MNSKVSSPTLCTGHWIAKKHDGARVDVKCFRCMQLCFAARRILRDANGGDANAEAPCWNWNSSNSILTWIAFHNGIISNKDRIRQGEYECERA
jgi:hypothetical protein